MSKKTVIGLAGVKTSGKSTVTGMVQDLLPNSKEAALADKLKNVCSDVFYIPRPTFDLQEYKEIPFSIFNMTRTLTIKDVADILFSFNVELTEDLHKSYLESKLYGMDLKSARHIAQIVGTEVLRATGNEDIHCDNVDLSSDITIISDLRFPNEFDYFKDNKDINFIPLYINRREAEKHVTEDSHISERLVFEFSKKCIEINNNACLENTQEQVQKVLEEKGLI